MKGASQQQAMLCTGKRRDRWSLEHRVGAGLPQKYDFSRGTTRQPRPRAGPETEHDGQEEEARTDTSMGTVENTVKAAWDSELAPRAG